MADHTKHLPPAQIEDLLKKKDPSARKHLLNYQAYGDPAKAEVMGQKYGVYAEEPAAPRRPIANAFGVALMVVARLAPQSKKQAAPDLSDKINACVAEVEKAENTEDARSLAALGCDYLEEFGGTFGRVAAEIVRTVPEFGRKNERPAAPPAPPANADKK